MESLPILDTGYIESNTNEPTSISLKWTESQSLLWGQLRSEQNLAVKRGWWGQRGASWTLSVSPRSHWEPWYRRNQRTEISSHHSSVNQATYVHLLISLDHCGTSPEWNLAGYFLTIAWLIGNGIDSSPSQMVSPDSFSSSSFPHCFSSYSQGPARGFTWCLLWYTGLELWAQQLVKSFPPYRNNSQLKKERLFGI